MVEGMGWSRRIVLGVQGSAKARLVTEVLAARRAEGEAERAASRLLDGPAHAKCHGWRLGASLDPYSWVRVGRGSGLRHFGAPEQDDAPVGGAGGGLRALEGPEPVEEVAVLGIRGWPVVLAALVVVHLPEAVLPEELSEVVHGGKP